MKPRLIVGAVGVSSWVCGLAATVAASGWLRWAVFPFSVVAIGAGGLLVYLVATGEVTVK